MIKINLDLLLAMADICDIKVEYGHLPTGLLGKANAETKTITLDTRLKPRSRLHKCVLAEEIGHILYPPRPGQVRYHSKGFYDMENIGMVKHIVAQDERKALDWAASVLVPDVEFWDAIHNGVDTVLGMMEYFEVEDWLVRHKIGYVRRKGRDSGERLKWKDIIGRT